MYKIYWMLFMFFSMISFLMFILNRKHLLSILLSLEFIVLMLFMMLFLFLNLFNFEMFITMIFLIFSVCEGVLGLSVLVSLIRTHGNDCFQSFNILQC